MNQRPKIIVICGPTATGKSDLAVAVAQHLHAKAEIISADSRQIYTHLDLGTGKITTDEMDGIPHHMLDVANPDTTYSVVQFQQDAKHCIEQILQNSHLPIVCGGTGQYIDALIQDIRFPNVPANEQLRTDLEAKSIEELHVMFNTLNKDQTHSVDLKNKRRVIRAIEILDALGHIPPLQSHEPYNTLYIGLDTDDTTLREKIKRRIVVRMDQGMIEESEKLLASGILTHERMQKLGLEYKYISDVLQEHITLEECKELLFLAIWHYAKRQRVWFKKNTQIHWVNTEDEQYKKKVFELVDDFIK